MTLYDHLSMPKEYAVEKPIDKKELLYPAFSDQQNEVLFNSVNEAVLKYRIGTTTVFDVVEVSVNEYQYFYFLPLSIFSDSQKPTLLVLEYNGKYKLCINITESGNETIKPYFTGWIDPANLQGRMISVLEAMSFEKLDLTNIEELLKVCKETIIENKAVYVTGNQIEFMVKFFVGYMKRGAITKIRNMVKNKCTAFAYQQKKGYRKGFNNYYRGYVYLYDLDELWNVLMGEDWIWDKLQNGLSKMDLICSNAMRRITKKTSTILVLEKILTTRILLFLMFYTKAVIGKGLIFSEKKPINNHSKCINSPVWF